MSKKTLTILVSFMWFAISFGQTLTPAIVASGGGSSTKSAYYLAYTIGETAVTTLAGTNFTLTQGFHQANPLPPDPTDEPMVASHNPVTSKSDNKLFITFYGKEIPAFHVSIYSLIGRHMGAYFFSDIFSREYRELDFTKFPSGLYFVKVVSTNGKILRTFKIEKL